MIAGIPPNDAEKEKICKMYVEEKLSTHAIGRELHFSATCISDTLIRMGIKIRSRTDALKVYRERNPRLPDEKIREVLRRCIRTPTITIAKTLGMSPKTVLKIIRGEIKQKSPPNIKTPIEPERL